MSTRACYSAFLKRIENVITAFLVRENYRKKDEMVRCTYAMDLCENECVYCV